MLSDPDNECRVSSASVWESAIKSALGEFGLGRSLAAIGDAAISGGFRTLDATWRHAAAVQDVALRHGYSFDRVLLAQCEVESLRFLTADQALLEQPPSSPPLIYNGAVIPRRHRRARRTVADGSSIACDAIWTRQHGICSTPRLRYFAKGLRNFSVKRSL